jgi:hypothetical protein
MLLTGAVVARLAHAEFLRMGDRQTDYPPFPLTRLVSKHKLSVRKSSIWCRKKLPTWGMC